MRLIRRFANLLIGVLLLGGLASGGPARCRGGPFWPRFNGPKGDNISADTGLLTEMAGGRPETPLDRQGHRRGLPSVSLAGGRIYTSGNLGEKTVVTGPRLGRQDRLAGPQRQGLEHGPSRRPLDTDRQRRSGLRRKPVGRSRLLRRQERHVDWHLNILEKFAANNIKWGLAESLLIDGGHADLLSGGPQTAVVALDKATGEVAWKSPTADGARPPTLRPP